VIRYTIITVLLLLAAFVVQQFLPAFTGMHHSRILLVQLVFLCCAVTVGQPVMLLLAFIGGFLWDAQCALGPHGGDPEVYTQPVENLRFGYSILLFGGMGVLMQGIQPLFRRASGSSPPCSPASPCSSTSPPNTPSSTSSAATSSHPGHHRQMVFTSMLTMLFSPLVFWMLFRIAKACDHSINPEAGRRRAARP
jgi:hypothetical protein